MFALSLGNSLAIKQHIRQDCSLYTKGLCKRHFHGPSAGLSYVTFIPVYSHSPQCRNCPYSIRIMPPPAFAWASSFTGAFWTKTLSLGFCSFFLHFKPWMDKASKISKHCDGDSIYWYPSVGPSLNLSIPVERRQLLCLIRLPFLNC